MIDALLVLNAGSSSLKFQAFNYDTLTVLAEGRVTRIGADAVLHAVAGDDEIVLDLASGADHEAALKAVLDFIDAHDDDWHIRGIAHRVVHGGLSYTTPVLVTPEIIEELASLTPLAPLHQPHNLEAISASWRLAEHAPDIACFDTGFHADHDALFTRFAIPLGFHDKGVRRYGFHGLSYAWIARELARVHPGLHSGRVVAAHLGNGASLCAIKEGRSLDTTMGMTALDGLPMGTRSGAIDAGAILYLLRDQGLSVDAVESLLYQDSGLKGLSGVSNDVETLLRSSDPEAAFALDYFSLKVAQFAAALAVSMGGMDAMVFTGGIGEHAAPIREKILAYMSILGAFEVLVIPANEELEMAIQAKSVLEAL